MAFFSPVWASEMTSFTPPRPRAFSERCPEGFVFAVADVEAEDLAAPVGGNAERDDDRLGHHPVVHPCFAVGRVEEYIRVAHRRQVPVPERADLMIQIRADPGHF
jgi:hypothetical protein